MGLNDTPSGERVHIGFFGRRNAGKSSLVNAVTGQRLAVVSDVAGTTTDPVIKAMELLPLGPVTIIDTPGIDDDGVLGSLRVEKTMQMLSKTDIAVLVVDAAVGMTKSELELKELFSQRKISCITVYNKIDLITELTELNENEIAVSAENGTGINELKEKIAGLAKGAGTQNRIVGDLLHSGDIAVLVTPIDEAAPKGRIILPQQQTIRDVLDSDAVCLVTKETQLKETLSELKNPPRLVITDSQVFGTVNGIVPLSVPLTSFSILMARYKGNLETAVRGAAALDALPEGARILISEGCTHHRQCGDIGTVKLPGWIKKHTGKEFNFEFTSGTEFTADPSRYDLIVHCGGCMLNEREMLSRYGGAREAGVPITNYGVLIAHMHGILKRSLSAFPELEGLLG